MVPLKSNISLVCAATVLAAVTLVGCAATQDMSDITPEDLLASGQNFIAQNAQKQAEINAQQQAQNAELAASGQQTDPQDLLVAGMSMLQGVSSTVQNQDAHISDLLPESVRNFLPNGGRPVPQPDETQQQAGGFAQPGQTVGGFQVAVDPYATGGISYHGGQQPAQQPQTLAPVPTQNFTATRSNGGISVNPLSSPQAAPAPANAPAPLAQPQGSSATLTDGIGNMFGSWVNQVSGGLLGQAAPTTSQSTLPPYAPPLRQSSSQSFDGTSANARSLLQRMGANANSMSPGRPVAPLAFDALPDDMSSSSYNNKDLFLSIMIPITLLVNEQIVAEREAILATGYRGPIQGAPLIIQQIANRYDVQSDVSTLLLHVDTLPISLMLAQSIEESGWGTSRFAQEGNALFGQYTWNANDPGMVPGGRPPGETYRIRAFPTLFDAMRSYALNLNRHDAYAEIRNARASIRSRGRAATGRDLVQGLAQYTSDPSYYIPAIQGHISNSALARYDGLQLAQGPMVRVLGGTAPAGR